jgi:hypothetical protein
LFRRIKKIKFLGLFLLLVFWTDVGSRGGPESTEAGYVQVVSEIRDSTIARHLVEMIRQSQNKLASFFQIQLRDSVTVILAASDNHFSDMTGNRLPEWTAAVAVPLYRKIILKPGTYYDPAVYRESLVHELAHIYMADKIGNGFVPLWINEGIAMYLSGKTLSWRESIAAGNAVLGNNLMSFSELDQLLRFGTGKAQIAYFQAMLAVQYLLENYGEREVQNILTALAGGISISDFFHDQYGIEYADFEYNYQKWLTQQYRWMAFLQFEYALWIFILLLVFAAILMIKLRNRKKISQWIEEDDVI